MFVCRTCNVFPTINYQGTLRHLQLLPHELREYEEQLEHALTRYLKRLQWLLSGSRRVFGTVVDKQCIFLIDTSGSMDEHMEELKKDLASLIWDQLYRYKVRSVSNVMIVHFTQKVVLLKVAKPYFSIIWWIHFLYINSSYR
jgi:ribosomal protein S15P/S13E